ncbi:MAG: hypothetical protein NTZ28_01750, partial [Nitrospirae bacterium]|nr:hypothetical protein [Nitrospirota bacterium]
ALLSAFVQNNQFREVTLTLPDVVRMIFDSKLFEHTTARSNATNENFIERLVRHQNGNAPGVTTADAMLTRFTDDLKKLAQNGGLTMSEGTTFFGNNLNNVSKALIAFAMQKYYDEQLAAGATPTELFTDLTTAGSGSGGGLQFDRADVAATLDKAKGYDLYFKNYLTAERNGVRNSFLTA